MFLPQRFEERSRDFERLRDEKYQKCCSPSCSMGAMGVSQHEAGGASYCVKISH